MYLSWHCTNKPHAGEFERNLQIQFLVSGRGLACQQEISLFWRKL